jgi:alpha-1,6-mannosyltransferase
VVLKTLHITNAWHPSSGGIRTFYLALLDSASALGWQMRVVVPGERNNFEKVGEFGGIYTVRAPRAPIHPDYRVLYPHTYLLPRSPIREILRTEQPHVIEVNDKYTLPYLAGLLRIGKIPEMGRRPAVVGISCERLDQTLSAYSDASKVGALFARAFMKCLYFTQFDHHIAVSRNVAEELETASRGHKVARGVWIRGMGVDVERFTPQRRSAEARAALSHKAGADPATALLLYAGRLAPEKNLPLLLDMLEQLRTTDCKLLIAGDGPARADFLDAAQNRVPGRFLYLNHETDRDRLADLFANVEAFLHPNPREPFGIAPLEAMAAGTPLVAPNRGGVTSYAHTGNAWLTDPNGPSFAQSVRNILEHPAQRILRTASARETALRFGWPAVCAEFHALYQDLYARTQGFRTRYEPAFYSTPGNWLGLETPSATSS